MSLTRKNKFLFVSIPLILILAGVVLYDYGYSKIEAERSAALEMEKLKMKTLEKSVSLIAQKPQLEKRLSDLKDLRKAQNAGMIDGNTSALATANMQNIVRTLITGRGGIVSSERAEKPEGYGKLKIITISMDTVLPDSRALSNILYAMETQTPHLVIRQLDTRVANMSKPKDLAVSFKVSALTAGR